MDTTNVEALKLLLKNKLDNLTKLSKSNISLKDAPQCSYVNIKGIRCTTKCFNTCNEPNPRCHVHINHKEVVQCSHVSKDENDNEIRCDRLTRSAKGLCHFHNVMIYNNNKAKAYYHTHREKIRQSSKLTRLMSKLDKITYEVDTIISGVNDQVSDPLAE